jgi:hypothetical protein
MGVWVEGEAWNSYGDLSVKHGCDASGIFNDSNEHCGMSAKANRRTPLRANPVDFPSPQSNCPDAIKQFLLV